MTFAEIIGLWPNVRVCADDLDGIAYGTVLAWKRRGRVPVQHWTRLVEAASKRGLKDVTTEAFLLASRTPPTNTGA